jgi:hypothetical protein
MSYRTAHHAGLVSFLLLAVVFHGGCSRSSDSPTAPSGSPLGAAAPTAEKPYVEVLLGIDNYQKASPDLAKGKKLKFKGELSLAGSKGKKIVVHLAGLYSGHESAIQAADLTRDFMTDRSAAEKKYKREQDPIYWIIIEGVVVSDVAPDGVSVRLAGHEG